MKRFIKKSSATELAPEDIFLDSQNLPDFEKSRLEGRLERPVEKHTFIIIGFLVFAVLFGYVAQAGMLQVVNGEKFATQSEKNRLRPILLFPNRGAILDRNGEPLVTNERAEDGSLVRTYKTPGFAHLLGYVTLPKKDKSGNYYETESIGMAGVEQSFQTQIAGTPGSILVEEDALGEIVSEGSVIPPTDGAPLTLSIDTRVQEAFASVVKELADRVPFTGGAALVMDVETGEIIALTSYPEYDPNILVRGVPSETIVGYNNDKRLVYLDRAVAGLYTPGSIVKPIVAIAALSENVISEWTPIVSTGKLVIPNPYDASKPTIFPDWKAHGATDMRDSIAVSSDVYFYQVGGGFESQPGLGIERLRKWYQKFGLDSPTHIELSGEKEGFIPSIEWKKETFDEDWRVGNTYHTAIGQYAMQVTPIEALRAISAIANDGVLVLPTLTKGGNKGGETIDVDQHALLVAREGMRKAVTSDVGTARGLNLPFVDVAAKTGTAQIGSEKLYVNNWVTGFWPYDNPKYAFIVVMEKGPQTNLTGGVYVAAQALLKMRDTAPEYFETVTP